MYRSKASISIRFRCLMLLPVILLMASALQAAPVYSRVEGEQRIAEFPGEALYYIQYADFLMGSGDFKDAAHILQKGKARVTPSADLLVKLGEAYEGQSLMARAQSATQEALQVNPDHVVAHVRMGEIYFRMGRNKSGLASYREAIDLAPGEDLPKVRLVSGLCKDEQLAAAQDQCLEFISTNAQSPDLWLSLGQVFEVQEKRREAFTTYGQVLTIDPQNSQAYARQGRLFCEFGQFQSAESACRRAVELEPENALGHAYLGIACAKLGHNDEARIHAELAENAGLNMVSVWKIIGN